jgi:acetyl-CoA synthetase
MTDLSTSNNNVGYLCTDWQVERGLGAKTALKLIDKDETLTEYSFAQLTVLSNQAANLLTSLGLHKGDRIMLLLSKTVEMFAFFLGGLKLGLNCCILFNSIGEDSIVERIQDTNTKAIISTSRMNFRLVKVLQKLDDSFRVLLVDENQSDGQFIGIQNSLSQSSTRFTTPTTDPEQYSHFHFTSGSTGKPKAVQHCHAAIIDHLRSFETVMQAKPDELYWCTADPGWVTGATYGITAPLASGLTQIQLDANYDPALWMHIIQRFKVNIFYTAPTVFRMMAQQADAFYQQYDLGSLKRVYTVGEPLDPNLVLWGRRVFHCEIYDTWFQTETGSIMIANRPGLVVKPGSMGKPLPYLEAAILESEDHFLPDNAQGLLCIRKPWNSMFREYVGNPLVYKNKFLGDFYSSGDIAYRDEDGYIWYIGRSDDVINTAGHLVSPFEIESAVIEVPHVLDCAVVGLPDDLLFEKVVAFVVHDQQAQSLRKLDMDIKLYVSKKVASLASPKEIVFTDKIPKTKSGKVMRRVLKKQYLGQDVGDLSTMEE